MAYLTKPSKKFIQYIDNYQKKYPLNLSPEEIMINNFSSSNLSDLYKLFLDIEDSKLNEESFNKLYNKINTNFSFEASSIFDINTSSISKYY